MFENRTKTNIKKKNYSSFFLSFLFILVFILILFNKTDYFIVNKIKYLTIDFATPVTKFISAPFTITANIGSRLNNIRYLEKQNTQLKEEIIRLKKWQTLAIKNTRENKVFKRLLNSTSNEIEVIKTASILSYYSNIYAKTIIINAGIDQKVYEDLSVINDKGLVGKIINSTNKNSKILLINDQNSSVPVRNLSGNSYSIITGSSNGKFLVSSFIKDDVMPKVGDLLVTSGNGKVFPRDILVGKIIKVNKDNYLALPYVDFDNLDYVQVIKSK